MRPIDADVLCEKIKEAQEKVDGAHVFFDTKAVLDMIGEVPALPYDKEADDGQLDK